MTRKTEELQDNASLSQGLDVMTLTPAVMGMRFPVMVLEAMFPKGDLRNDEGEKAVVEKTAAMMETFGAVQAELSLTWSKAWFAAVNGHRPNPVFVTQSLERVASASLHPSAKRLRANYQRLSSLQD